MEEITPEQKAQLSTWAGQRDAILSEISSLRTEKERLTKINSEIALSSIDIETRINQSIGRMAELDVKEKEYADIVNGSLMEANINKTTLETEITGLKKIIEILAPQKESLEKDIEKLSEIFFNMNDRVSMLNKVVEHVTTVNNQNLSSVDIFVENIKKSLQEVIDVNQKNVTETNLVLEKLPAMLVELQKQGLVKHKI